MSTVKTLESLSNELLLDVFEYLDAYNLYQAFSGLNQRLNNLLRLASIHIEHNPIYNNRTIWEQLESFFNPSQIRILSAYDTNYIDTEFLSLYNKNLRSIRLVFVNIVNMDSILEQFSNDNQLNYVHLQNNYNFWLNPTPIVDLMLITYAQQFSSLVNLALVSNCDRLKFPDVTVTFSKLRRLLISDLTWTTDFLRFLDEKTPNLRSLKLLRFSNSTIPVARSIKHISELHINGVDDLSNLNMVLSSFPCLRRLHLDWFYPRRATVINGNQLQPIIEKNVPNLKQLTIGFDRAADEEILKTFYTGEFWLKKKVKAKMTINKLQSRYRSVKTIYFGHEWSFRYFNDYSYSNNKHIV